MEGVGRRVWVLGAVVGLNGAKNKTHFFRIFLTLALLTVVIIYRQVLQPVNRAKGLIVTSVEFASYNLQLPAIFCCLIMTNAKTLEVEDFVASITLLDKKLASMGFPIDYTGTNRLVRTLAAFLIFKLVLQQVPFCIKGFRTTTDYLDYIAYNLPFLIIHVLLLQWITYLSVLRLHFKTVNTILKTSQLSKCWVVEDFRKSRTSLGGAIRACGTIYDDLCKQAEKINTAFAWQILSLVPTIFILIIFTSFQTCRMIKKLTPFDSVWIIFDVLYSVTFLELVVPCVAVQKESNKFNDVLHRINSHEIDDAVNSLILQSYYQNIEFSACGVFPLDGTLIYTVLGSLTTYLVILIQFDL